MKQQLGKQQQIHINKPERPRDQCGIFSINTDKPNSCEVVYLGLQALQHRGQESAGISFRKDNCIKSYKGIGLVSQCFTRNKINETDTTSAVGHVRYSTSGSNTIANIQPIVVHSSDGYSIAVAHNGNLSNSKILWQNLLDLGHIFRSTSDTEIIVTFLFHNRHLGLVEAAKNLMKIAKGAFSVIAMDNEEMVAFRDPWGFRPLSIGRLSDGYIFSSETCALDTVGASFLREIKPGEIVSAKNGMIHSYNGLPMAESFCIFEYIYFARPDSMLNGISVYEARKNIGAELAKKVSTHLDIIVPSPDSGISAAMGMAEATGIPLEWAIHRNPYGGRTFINPTQSSREMGARIKYNPITPLVRDKHVAIVDDSLVRGTTARQLTSMMKKAGAKSVHFFIAAAPYRFPCYYGIDIPLVEELAFAATNPEKFAETIGCDSLYFNTLDDLHTGIGRSKDKLCSACFNGVYPV